MLSPEIRLRAESVLRSLYSGDVQAGDPQSRTIGDWVLGSAQETQDA